MSARSIGEIVAPIVAKAIGLSSLQEFLDDLPGEDRASWVAYWLQYNTISADEADLLVEHNRLEVE